MKRIFIFIMVFLLLAAFSGCNFEQAKEDVFGFVENNYEVILNACENGDFELLQTFDEIKTVNADEGYIIVLCKGYGIAPSSQDYGFYYSPEGLPAAVDCNLEIIRYSEDLSPEGNGFECTVDYNTFYTERIKGNIYFYRNAY